MKINVPLSACAYLTLDVVNTDIPLEHFIVAPIDPSKASGSYGLFFHSRREDGSRIVRLLSDPEVSYNLTDVSVGPNRYMVVDSNELEISLQEKEE